MFGSSPGNTVGSLTATQHSVLVGSLLGDGSLRIQGRGSRRLNALLEVNHSVQFKEYVDWKHEVFQSFVLTPPKPRAGNGTRVAYRFTTQSLPVFTDYFRWFYGDGKKAIPRDLELDPLILAVWFMDDGSKSRSACYLNTQQFTTAEQSLLIERLAQTFGIEGHLNRDKQYFRLRITTRGTRKLMDLIRPFILPCFRYKLLDDPVTTDPKGEAPDSIRGNTPTLAIPTETTQAPC
jgi:hypothetical protein